jgi:predicted aspartyl protease
MNPYYEDLDRTPVTDPSDPSRVTHYAIVPVTIAGLTEDEVSIPPSSEKAMIDTGATSSAIHPSLADDLGLRQVGHEFGNDSREPASLYRVRVTISVIGGEWDLYVIGREYDPHHLFRVIIGTDILKDCGFTFNGPGGRGRFGLAYFPSAG